MILEKGDLIGERYEVMEQIGTGGMAIVYKAMDKKLSRCITLKVMRAEYAQDEEFLKRFNVEARAAASISHQNLVNVYDVGSDGLINYIVMEYIDGVTLKELIKKKAPFSNDETLGVAIQVSTALEHAHKNNIIHRDIKPQNILVTTEGIVKVTDFGIAKAVTEATLTAPGSTMGSVHYFSPEQARGIYVDFKSDVYSLGIVMFEMATGVLPFDGETPVAIALKHINDPLPDIRAYNPDVSESLVKIILLATQKLTAKRYQTVEDLNNHLKRALTNNTGDFIRSADEDAEDVQPTVHLSDEQVDDIRRGARKIFLDNDKSVKIEDLELSDEDDEFEREREAKTERRVVFAAIITSLAIIAAICWFVYNMYMQSLPVLVAVPQFTGRSLEEAVLLAEELNITITEAGSLYTDEAPEGYILEQLAPPGEMIPEGESVPVVISLGVDRILIPDVLGKTYDEAFDIFDSLPFKTSIEEIFDDRAPVFTVAKQEPPGDTYAEYGANLTIYISVGPESSETEVPDVREMTEAEAKRALADANLLLGDVNYMESPNIPEGRVISQTVPPGREVQAHTTAVGIMISRGPASPSAATSTPAPTESPAPSETPAPTETPTPTPAPTPEPTPEPTPPPEETNEVVRTLIIALPFKPEGLTKIEYQLIKISADGQWIEASGEAEVTDFPIDIDVKGTGKARYDFYIRYDGAYRLQSTENIDFGDGN